MSYSLNFKTSTCWNPIITVLLVDVTKPLPYASSYHLCNMFKTKLIAKCCTCHSTLQVSTTRPPDHHSSYSLQFRHILHFHSHTQTLWIQVLDNFPLTFRDAQICIPTGASLLNFALVQRTLDLDTSSAPLHAPIMASMTHQAGLKQKFHGECPS